MDIKLKLFVYRKSELVRQNETQTRQFVQIGDNTKLKLTYNDAEYIYEESMNKNYYILYSKDEIDCIVVVIDKDKKIAEINSIGSYTSCLDDVNINVHSTLLKITFNMLKKYKDKFNINKILLTDNSLKKCHNKNIILSIMLILLTGDTWYGKYGFRPSTQRLIKKYENNKKIMNTITLKDVDLIKYLLMTKLDEKVIESSKKFIEKHSSMLLKDYLSKFIKEYDNTCIYFYDFYEELFDDLRLYNFYKNTFELTI